MSFGNTHTDHCFDAPPIYSNKTRHSVIISMEITVQQLSIAGTSKIGNPFKIKLTDTIMPLYKLQDKDIIGIYLNDKNEAWCKNAHWGFNNGYYALSSFHNTKNNHQFKLHETMRIAIMREQLKFIQVFEIVELKLLEN